jgi:hypothetical protein
VAMFFLQLLVFLFEAAALRIHLRFGNVQHQVELRVERLAAPAGAAGPGLKSRVTPESLRMASA